MNKEGDTPMIDRNVLLLNAQKAYIRMVRNIVNRDQDHQPREISQQSEV
jgi:hypothetical protein